MKDGRSHECFGLRNTADLKNVLNTVNVNLYLQAPDTGCASGKHRFDAPAIAKAGHQQRPAASAVDPRRAGRRGEQLGGAEPFKCGSGSDQQFSGAVLRNFGSVNDVVS